MSLTQTSKTNIMHRYKLLSALIFILIVSAALLSFYACRIIIATAKWQLEKTFPASSVSIGGCRLDIGRRLVFSDIEIKRKDTYDFKIGEVNISYRIPSVFIGAISGISAEGMSFTVDAPQKSAKELKDMINLSRRSIFRVYTATLSNLRIKFTSRDIEFDGMFLFRIYPTKKIIQQISVSIDNLETRGVSLKKTHIEGGLSADNPAGLSIEEIIYNKSVITDVTGSVFAEGATLFLEHLTAQLFDGNILGKIKVEIDEKRTFSTALTCSGLDITRFIEDFKLGERFRITGTVNGSISFKGEQSGIEDISGALSINPPGGVLVIKDTSFLENMAKKSKQSLDIVMESFKNYEYNIGDMKVSLDGSNLILDIVLEGETGKRTFNIILHDIAIVKRRAL